MSEQINNYCLECRHVATDHCYRDGHTVGTLTRTGDEEKNLSGANEISPLPAQVEGLATPRPWAQNREFVIGANNKSIAQFFSKREEEYENASANAELIVTAVNEYESNKAKIEALTAILKRCEFDFAALITRGDLAEEPRAHETLRRIRAALIGSPDTKKENA